MEEEDTPRVLARTEERPRGDTAGKWLSSSPGEWLQHKPVLLIPGSWMSASRTVQEEIPAASKPPQASNVLRRPQLTAVRGGGWRSAVGAAVRLQSCLFGTGEPAPRVLRGFILSSPCTELFQASTQCWGSRAGTCCCVPVVPTSAWPPSGRVSSCRPLSGAGVGARPRRAACAVAGVAGPVAAVAAGGGPSRRRRRP